VAVLPDCVPVVVGALPPVAPPLLKVGLDETDPLSDGALATAAGGAGLAATWLPACCADAATIAKAPSSTPTLAAVAFLLSERFRSTRLGR